jgi:hypothetical protein
VIAMRVNLIETSPEYKQALNDMVSLSANLAKQEKDEPAVA